MVKDVISIRPIVRELSGPEVLGEVDRGAMPATRASVFEQTIAGLCSQSPPGWNPKIGSAASSEPNAALANANALSDSAQPVAVFRGHCHCHRDPGMTSPVDV